MPGGSAPGRVLILESALMLLKVWAWLVDREVSVLLHLQLDVLGSSFSTGCSWVCWLSRQERGRREEARRGLLVR